MTPAAPEQATGSADQSSEPSGRLERRKRLRQFQADLAERIQAAREQTGDQDNWLGVQIGNDRWLLSMQEIGEIVSMMPVTRVPLTREWYLGLLNIRGNLVGIIDFARYCGAAPTALENTSRIVTFAPALGINCGLLVSRVFGLRNVSRMTHEAAQDESNGCYRDSDGQQWGILNLHSIAQDPRFLHIGL